MKTKIVTVKQYILSESEIKLVVSCLYYCKHRITKQGKPKQRCVKGKLSKIEDLIDDIKRNEIVDDLKL